MSTVFVDEQVRLPTGIKDLTTFRRWARSQGEKLRGWVSFLDGELWVDNNMEKLFSHNRVKTHNGTTLNHFVESEQLGYYFSDRVLLTNKQANLSTEPDGTFVSFSALEDKRVRFVGGSEGDFVELVGTPDMVLEIVSRFSVTKDSKVLRELYRRAEIREYWLVDARDDPMQFDILRLSSRGYLPSRRENGWVKSAIFGRSFALQKKKDRLGNPQYWLQVKE